MIYETGHPFLRPKDSGLIFGSLSDEELKKLGTGLTDMEKRAPHAVYYSDKPIRLSELFQKAISGGPMDPAQAFMPEEYGKHMNNTGHCAVENGYCVLPNGVTYAAVLLRQEGRTDEMIRWYNEKFAPEENLFYKTWLPGYHYLHYNNGAFEDFGFGRMNMRFACELKADEMGLDSGRIAKNDPACIGIGSTSAIGYNLDSNHPEAPQWNTIAFYHRITDYGREMRIRLWYGYGRTENGVVLTPPAAEEALDVAKKTMIHVMMEYSNDQYLETRFWADSKKNT